MEDVFLGLLIVVIMLIVFINILLKIQSRLDRLSQQMEILYLKYEALVWPSVEKFMGMKEGLDEFKEQEVNQQTKENPDLVYSPGKDSRGEAKGYKDDFYE